MGFPYFARHGVLLFCRGKLAASCCRDHILTITLSLVGNIGVYNAVSFSFGGTTWGNNCGTTGGGWINGVNRGPWVSQFDMVTLAGTASPIVDVIIRADCNQWHDGDSVGYIGISAAYHGHIASGVLVPSPVNDYDPQWTPRCPPSTAANKTVRATFKQGVTIL